MPSFSSGICLFCRQVISSGYVLFFLLLLFLSLFWQDYWLDLTRMLLPPRSIQRNVSACFSCLVCTTFGCVFLTGGVQMITTKSHIDASAGRLRTNILSTDGFPSYSKSKHGAHLIRINSNTHLLSLEIPHSWRKHLFNKKILSCFWCTLLKKTARLCNLLGVGSK